MGIYVHLHAYACGRHAQRAGAVLGHQRLSGGQYLPMGLHRGSLVGFGHIDVHIVVGTVVVAGRADHLGHPLRSTKPGTAAHRTAALGNRLGTSLGRRRAALIDQRDVELRLDRGLLHLQGAAGAYHFTARVLPGAAHDDAETHDSTRHHVASAQARQFLVLELDRVQHFGVDRQAGRHAGQNQPDRGLHAMLPGASCTLFLEEALEEIASNEAVVQQIGILDRREAVQAAFGRQRQRRVEQGVLLVVALADHREDDAVPAL